MALNFDAQINVDVAPFIANIERAKASVKALENQITSLNQKKVTVQANAAGAAAGSDATNMAARKAAANQMMQSMAMEEQMAKRVAATRKDGSEANVRGLARERYALYDVAAAYQQVASMATAAVQAMAGTAIAYERAFANVDRTTEFTSIKVGEAARVMKYSLMEVAAEIPVAFGKVTEIATIANQLGVAQGEVAKFSKTVAQFASTTGMTVQATAMAFGRIGELTTPAGAVADYNALASSIAFAGVKAVATEEQIVSVTKEIATTAKMAKFSTPDIVGLATALSSVGIAPEAARGSIMRTFAGINEAVSKGGSALQQYATISGMSAEEFKKTWTENGQVAFDGFVKGLQGMSDSGQNLDSVLRGIGLKNVRDIQTIQKLGDNYNVYADSIRNANQAYLEGTFLSDSYGKIQETVASKLELIKNNWDNFMAGLGESGTGDVFKGLLDAINATLRGLTEMSRSPVGYWLGAVLTTVSLLAIAVGALNGAVALGRAAMLAFAVAMDATKVSADGTTVSINRATLASKIFWTTAKATVWLAAIALVVEGLVKLSEAMAPVEAKAEAALGGFAGLQDALTKDYAAAIKTYGSDTKVAMAIASGAIDGATISAKGQNSAYADAVTQATNLAMISGTSLPKGIGATTGAIAQQNIVLGENYTKWLQVSIQQSKQFKDIAKDTKTADYFQKVGYSFEAASAASRKGGDAVDKYFANIEAKGKKLGLNAPTILKSDWWNGFDFPLEILRDTFKGAANETYLLGLGLDGLGDSAGTIPKVVIPSLTDLTKGAKNAKEAVKTVVDYASQMVNIFKRIDDITFSKQSGLDDIAAGWRTMKTSADEATKSIQKAKETIASISADKGILEYKLSVAVRYGDTKRATALRAEIAKKTSELADANADLTKAQAATNKSLTDNTETGAANRAGMVDMLGKYQSYIQALMATGMKGTELEKKVADLKKEFVDQGTKIGYNTTELALFSGQFDQYAKAVHDTPRDVTIEFDATKSAEFNAVQEYLAKEHLLNVKLVYDSSGTANTGGAVSLPTGTGAKAKTPAATTSNPAAGLKLPPAAPAVTTKPTTPASPAGLSTYLKVYNDLRAEMISWNKKNWWDQTLTKFAHGMVLDNAAKYIAKWEATNGLKYKPFDVKLAYADGGYVSGPGGSRSDSIPARLSNGEFVMNAASVKTYGLDFMNSLNQMKYGRMPVSAGSAASSNGGSQVVYLSPDDRALLRAAIDRPVNLFTETGKIASSANAGNVLLAQRGTN